MPSLAKRCRRFHTHLGDAAKEERKPTLEIARIANGLQALVGLPVPLEVVRKVKDRRADSDPRETVRLPWSTPARIVNTAFTMTQLERTPNAAFRAARPHPHDSDVRLRTERLQLLPTNALFFALRFHIEAPG
jgi:hypothetical protein